MSKVVPLRAQDLSPRLVFENVFDAAAERGSSIKSLVVVAEHADGHLEIFGTEVEVETFAAMAVLIQSIAASNVREQRSKDDRRGDA